MLLLFTISVLLIYSLLMLSVESKSFDLGVMRMVGLSKTNVIVLVIMQSFTFVIPSIITGFTVSLISLQACKYYAENYLHMDFEATPTLFSVV
jgi:ABC-type antimicrobial peptide transport system permease subunit